MLKKHILIWLSHLPLITGVVVGVVNAGMLDVASIVVFYFALIAVLGGLLIIIILIWKERKCIGLIYKLVGIIYTLIFIYLSLVMVVVFLGYGS